VANQNISRHTHETGNNIVKFAEEDPAEGYFITAYNEISIQVNGKNFDSSLIIAPDAIDTEWSPTSIDTLRSEHFSNIIKLNPELVLLGTGSKLTFPAIETYAQLITLGIGVDVMDTGAACRTYNILMGEGRRVIAGLILPG
jgi:uncharacterized protein